MTEKIFLVLFFTIIVARAYQASDSYTSDEEIKSPNAFTTIKQQAGDQHVYDEANDIGINPSTKFAHFFNGSYGVYDVLEELLNNKSLTTIIPKRK